jgi:hypothetical protein
MDYRIDLLGVPKTQSVPIQMITVPCGVFPNILVPSLTLGTRCVWYIVDNFDNMNILRQGISYRPSGGVDSPYLSEYMSICYVGQPVFKYTSNVESDCCLFGWVYNQPNPDDPYEVIHHAFKLCIQFRNINQNGVYDGYQYQ